MKYLERFETQWRVGATPSQFHHAILIMSRLDEGKDTHEATFHMSRVIEDDPLFEEAVNKIKAVVPNLPFLIVDDSNFSMISNNDLVVFISRYTNYYTIKVAGDKVYVNALREALNDWKDKPYIDWYFISQGVSHQTFPFEFPGIVHDCHYPYLDEGIEAYMEAYQEHKAPILLLMGEPGTGKSTFIKHYIRKFSIRSMLTHDEQLLASDGFLMKYLSSAQNDLLIVEDADLLLKSRKFEGNKIMAKLLNISDGVLEIPKKKMIFSTNLTDIQSLDEAIIRPGRCFDIINFRKLSHGESIEVCRIHGLQVPSDVSKQYTLAELFNNREFNSVPEKKLQLGLIKGMKSA